MLSALAVMLARNSCKLQLNGGINLICLTPMLVRHYIHWQDSHRNIRFLLDIRLNITQNASYMQSRVLPMYIRLNITPSHCLLRSLGVLFFLYQYVGQTYLYFSLFGRYSGEIFLQIWLEQTMWVKLFYRSANTNLMTVVLQFKF